MATKNMENRYGAAVEQMANRWSADGEYMVNTWWPYARKAPNLALSLHAPPPPEAFVHEH